MKRIMMIGLILCLVSSVVTASWECPEGSICSEGNKTVHNEKYMVLLTELSEATPTACYTLSKPGFKYCTTTNYIIRNGAYEVMNTAQLDDWEYSNNRALRMQAHIWKAMIEEAMNVQPRQYI